MSFNNWFNFFFACIQFWLWSISDWIHVLNSHVAVLFHCWVIVLWIQTISIFLQSIQVDLWSWVKKNCMSIFFLWKLQYHFCFLWLFSNMVPLHLIPVVAWTGHSFLHWILCMCSKYIVSWYHICVGWFDFENYFWCCLVSCLFLCYILYLQLCYSTLVLLHHIWLLLLSAVIWLALPRSFYFIRLLTLNLSQFSVFVWSNSMQ